MDKEDLLLIIKKSLEEDRLAPEIVFQRMIDDELIDADGKPIQRKRRLIFGDRPPE
jgi:hypothetical protein